MIIQRVLKGIAGLDEAQAKQRLETGILCRWWQNVDPLPQREVPLRLTDRNLDWHQNYYDAPDPLEGGNPFHDRTPFISTTAGTIERDTFYQTNTLTPAWEEALKFATDTWNVDGYLFYCYVLIIGRPAVRHPVFAEELRDLSVYTGFSWYQPEGEITAKIIIPPAQIEKAEFWSSADALAAVSNGSLPGPDPSKILRSPLFVQPSDYNNVRDFLS